MIYYSFRGNIEITNSKIPSHRATSNFSEISSRCTLKYLPRYPLHLFHVESEISLKEGIIGWMQTLCLLVEESALIGYRFVDLSPVVIFDADALDLSSACEGSVRRSILGDDPHDRRCRVLASKVSTESACGRRDQPRLGETRRDEKEVQEVPPVDSEARALLRRRASLETSAHIEPESHE